jgi:hypothetical protein
MNGNESIGCIYKVNFICKSPPIFAGFHLEQDKPVNYKLMKQEYRTLIQIPRMVNL